MDYYYYDDQSENNLEQGDDYYEYDQVPESFIDVYKGCITASSLHLQYIVMLLVGCGLLHRILWKVLCNVIRRIRETTFLYHIISTGSGLLGLWLYVGSSTTYVFLHVLNICSFLRIIIALNVRHKGLFLCVYTIGCQLIAECLLKEEKYETIRGPSMVVSMKIISVAFDIQDATETYQWFPVVGYLCSPSSLILGPWISFKSYKRDNRVGITRWQQLLKIVLYLILSMIFLNLSNCMLPWLKQLWNGGLWYRTYLDALSVRCSHYFISYLSHATLLVNCWPEDLSGHSNSFQIVKPLQVEFPHSLSTAIRNWNIPMHYWLKSNIFQRVRSTKYSYSISLLGTYLVSCLVHGFNYKVHLVLVSLGTFSYFENNLRRTLAHVFNACIEASPCRQNCKYMYCSVRLTRGRWIVRLVNYSFSLIVVIQLAYLGVMLNTNNNFTMASADIFHVWSNMNYFGHFLASAMALFYVAI